MTSVLRSSVSVASRMAPRLGGAVAESLWFRPRGRPMRGVPEGAEMFSLAVMGRDVSGFTLGNGDAVLLLHGWGGAATDMSSLAVAVADAGYQAVVPNLPGHGPDRKSRTDLFTMAAAVDALGTLFGLPRAVVAHSFGAPVTFASFPQGGPERVVLIAPAIRGERFYDYFVQHLGLGNRARRNFMNRFERFAGPHLMGVMTGEGDVPGADMLVIHDPADDRTAFEDSADYVESRTASRLISVPGPGHKRILNDERTIAETVAFITAVG